MENEHAIELPPLGGKCLYEKPEENSIVVCNETLAGGFSQKTSIHNHIDAHVAELAKRLGVAKYGTSTVKAGCFHCNEEPEFRTMVRHIETSHFGVQRWNCKHCDEKQKFKTRMDSTTVNRHIKTCRNLREAAEGDGSEEEEE